LREGVFQQPRLFTSTIRLQDNSLLPDGRGFLHESSDVRNMTGRKRIWIWLILASVGGLLGYLRLISGRVVQRLQSPDGQIVATVREFRHLSEDSIGIELRTKSNPLRHSVFTGLNYGTSVAISWKNPRNLVVECTACANLSIYGCEQRWHDVTIHYVWRDGSPEYPPTTFSKGVGNCGESANAQR